VAGAHNQAEHQALTAVYPYRAALAGVGSAELTEQVHRVAQIQRLMTSTDQVPPQEDAHATDNLR
jgi:hypothetical protein